MTYNVSSGTLNPTIPYLDIQRQVGLTEWPWNVSYGSFKIIENGTIRFESLGTVS